MRLDHDLASASERYQRLRAESDMNLTNPQPTLADSALTALGRLMVMGGEWMLSHADQMGPEDSAYQRA